jgi:hypothetical protein
VGDGTAAARHRSASSKRRSPSTQRRSSRSKRYGRPSSNPRTSCPILTTPYYSVNHGPKHSTSTHSPQIPKMGRAAAACSRSFRFGLGDQWRFSVNSKIHPPFWRNVDPRNDPQIRPIVSTEMSETSETSSTQYVSHTLECQVRLSVSDTTFCVAVREDLLNAISQYVKCIAKSFKISVIGLRSMPAFRINC